MCHGTRKDADICRYNFRNKVQYDAGCKRTGNLELFLSSQHSKHVEKANSDEEEGDADGFKELRVLRAVSNVT